MIVHNIFKLLDKMPSGWRWGGGIRIRRCGDITFINTISFSNTFWIIVTSHFTLLVSVIWFDLYFVVSLGTLRQWYYRGIVIMLEGADLTNEYHRFPQLRAVRDCEACGNWWFALGFVVSHRKDVGSMNGPKKLEQRRYGLCFPLRIKLWIQRKIKSIR